MFKLNAFRMKLAILLLLSFTVSTLARPQNDNANNMNNDESNPIDPSKNTGNSGNSKEGGLELEQFVDQLFIELKPILGEEIVLLLKTVLAPVLKLPLNVVEDTLIGIAKGPQDITKQLIEPALSGFLPALTSLFATPVNLLKLIGSLLSKLFGFL